MLILGVYLLLAFFNLYHLLKFGFFDFTGKLTFVIFSSAWVIIMVFTFIFLKDVPWLDSFDLFSDTFGQIDFGFKIL